MLSAIDRNHCPQSIGTPVRNRRNPQPPEHAPTLSSPRISGERFFAIDLGDRFFGDPSLKFESWLTIWRSRLTRRIFRIRRLRRSPPPPERPIIQAIKTPAALREADVHAVINERVRRYSKLSWKLSRFGSFCLRDRMPVFSINRLLCERVSMPGPHRCTKRQAGDYRLPHGCILLLWGSAQANWVVHTLPSGSTARLTRNGAVASGRGIIEWRTQ